MSDTKLALRLVRKEPVTSTLVVLVLGVGIFGNAAMFGLFERLFLAPLPFPEPDRVVYLDEAAPQWGLDFVSVAYPDFSAWRSDNHTFEAMAAYRDDDMNLVLGGRARRVTVAKVTHDLAAVLRVSPLLGRHISPEEDAPDAPKVVLLAESTWRGQFGANPDILGETVSLDSVLYEVIGVLPERSRFIENADAWIPLATTVDEQPGAWYLRAIGRLSPGVGLDEARQDLERIHKEMVDARPANEVTTPVVVAVPDRLLGRYRPGTAALLVAVGLVLLMACGNVSGLMLVRAKRRDREFRIRAAIGASRYRIARQLLVESLLLALAAGVVGAILGHHALRVAVHRLLPQLPPWIRFDLDAEFLGFSALLVVVTALLSGLLPAVRTARIESGPVARRGVSAGEPGPRRRFGAHLFVVAQVAFAIVLLVSSALLIQSIRSILAVDPGFRPEGLLTYRVSLPVSEYVDSQERYRFFERHIEHLMGLPGVESAGVVNTAPLGTHEGAFFKAEGQTPPDADGESPVVLARVASAGYFRTTGVRLLRGRLPDATDHSARVALVNESFVKRFWPGVSIDDVPGRRIRPASRSNDAPWLDVVGVLADVKHYGLDEETRPGMYYLYGDSVGSAMTVAVRTSGHPEAVLGPARAAVRRLDPAIPIFDTLTMEDRIDRSLWPRRAATALATAFAAYALLLASAGVYGVLSAMVGLRTGELAVRLALGAPPREVVLGVLYRGMGRVLLGLTLGMIVALLLSRMLASLLFGVSENDPWVYALVASVVLLVAGFANWLPARRAARIDILQILRTE